MARAGISLCMIVKNERGNLASCLKSVLSLVDEIIIVDTGSNDGTPEIARDFTSHVFHFNWCNDFSAARNVSLSKATQPWILILDADERFEKSSLDWFQSDWDHPDVDGYFVTIRNKVKQGNPEIIHRVVRLFRNRKNLRFERSIHEIVPIAEQKTGLSDLQILHLGYADEGKNPERHRRNEAMLLEFKKQNAHLPSADFYLAQHYFSKGDQQKALDFALKTLNKKPEPFLKRLSLRIALEISAHQKDLSGFKNLKTEYHSVVQTWPETHLFEAIVNHKNGDLNATLTHLDQFFMLRDEETSGATLNEVELPAAYLRRAYELRAHTHSQMGFLDAALNDYEKAISTFPHNWSLLAQKGQILFKQGKLNQSAKIFQNVVELLSNEDDKRTLMNQYATLVTKIRNLNQ